MADTTHARCYPEGLIADHTIRVLKEKASDAAHTDQVCRCCKCKCFEYFAEGLERSVRLCMVVELLFE